MNTTVDSDSHIADLCNQNCSEQIRGRSVQYPTKMDPGNSAVALQAKIPAHSPSCPKSVCRQARSIKPPKTCLPTHHGTNARFGYITSSVWSMREKTSAKAVKLPLLDERKRNAATDTAHCEKIHQHPNLRVQAKTNTARLTVQTRKFDKVRSPAQYERTFKLCFRLQSKTRPVLLQPLFES